MLHLYDLLKILNQKTFFLIFNLKINLSILKHKFKNHFSKILCLFKLKQCKEMLVLISYIVHKGFGTLCEM